jgi:hypothetical protein
LLKKPICIISPGYSFNPNDVELLNNLFTTIVINHAARDFVNNPPDHFACLDHPLTFNQETMKKTTVHTSIYWHKFHPLYPKIITYEFEAKPNDLNPFEQEKMQQPYLTFLFAIQVAMRMKPDTIYLYGSDFIMNREQNYYFKSGKIEDKTWESKKKALDDTLTVFKKWIKFAEPTKFVSLSKESKLNDIIKYLDIKDL